MALTLADTDRGRVVLRLESELAHLTIAGEVGRDEIRAAFPYLLRCRAHCVVQIASSTRAPVAALDELREALGLRGLALTMSEAAEVERKLSVRANAR